MAVVPLDNVGLTNILPCFSLSLSLSLSLSVILWRIIRCKNIVLEMGIYLLFPGAKEEGKVKE